MKTIDASNIVKTMNFKCAVSSDEVNSIVTIRDRNGIYRSECYLPLIDKTIIGIGNSSIEAVDNTYLKASAIIDEYLEDHPDLIDKEFLEDSNYVLEEDEYGFLSLEVINKSA